jgi:copper chaperone CopZ
MMEAAMAQATVPRHLRLVHELPGRIRLRASWFREEPEEARRIATALAALEGVMEVRVRPRTGSILCRCDPERVDAARLLGKLRALTGVDMVLGPTDPPPIRVGVSPAAGGSSVGRATAKAFREIDEDLLRYTEGRLDLGTLTTLGFLVAGGLEMAVTRTIPIPPWFNLAWWGFRTFMSVEARAIRRTPA